MKIFVKFAILLSIIILIAFSHATPLTIVITLISHHIHVIYTWLLRICEPDSRSAAYLLCHKVRLRRKWGAHAWLMAMSAGYSGFNDRQLMRMGCIWHEGAFQKPLKDILTLCPLLN